MDAEPLVGKSLQAVRLPPASITAYEGSVRSSKTFSSLIDWTRFIRQGPPGHLLMTGKTERTIINNLIIPLQDLLGAGRVKINRGNGTVEILGRQVLVVGANNEAARTKIQGLTLAGAYVDEASTLPESYFSMLYSRLSVAGARLWLTSNPEGPVHWLLVNWLDKARLWIDRDGKEHPNPDGLDLNRVSFKLEDNAYLVRTNPDYIERTKRSYSGLWYRRYILGEWCAAEGAVYDMWDPDKHVIPYASLPPIRRIFGIGIDHGMTNPSAGILLAMGYNRRLYALDEWWLAPGSNGAKLTVQQQSAHLQDWLRTALLPEWPKPEWVIVDPAAAAFRVQLHHDGVAGVTGADNEVVSGISTVSSLIGSGVLQVTDRCRNLIREIPSYSWDDKATGKGEDKPVKVADHACDAFRYAVATTESLWRGEILTEHH